MVQRATGQSQPVGPGSQITEASYFVMMKHEDKTSQCGIKHFSGELYRSSLTDVQKDQ